MTYKLPNLSINATTAQLVDKLYEFGPDVDEIARRLGQYKESVRYRYNHLVLGNKLSVQAAADHEKLGLRRMIALAEFSKEYAAFGEPILLGLNQLSYSVGHTRSLIDGRYAVHMSAPTELYGRVRDGFRFLEQKGVLRKAEVLEFDWFRRQPMKAEFFDFETGTWDWDWSSRHTDYGAAAETPSAKERFDFEDLLILKELQKDAARDLRKIATGLKIPYKNAAWHKREHVLGRRLLKGFTVSWMETDYDWGLDKAKARPHKYLGIMLVARNPGETKMMELRRELTRLPFLWAEAAGRDYYAELALPLTSVTEGLGYLGKAVSGLDQNAEIMTIDQYRSLNFTIPYEQYDVEGKRWAYDGARFEERFGNLVLQVKSQAFDPLPK